jgi:hypothetical protein
MALYVGHFDFMQPLLRVVPSLFTQEECAQILRSTEGVDWLAATINCKTGRVIDRPLRDSSTAVLHDPTLANTLYERARGTVPSIMNVEEPSTGQRVSMEPVGVFLPLRVYRYETGQRFGLHQDQSYTREDGARSLLTLLVYLNDDFSGGETDFPEQKERISPRTGDALWFQHMLLHAGRPATEGAKYVLRSDVLYDRVDRER